MERNKPGGRIQQSSPSQQRKTHVNRECKADKWVVVHPGKQVIPKFIPLELFRCACLNVFHILGELTTWVHTQLKLALHTQAKLTRS